MKSPTMRKDGRPARAQLLVALATIGITSLGGWPSYYHDAFVVKRRWLSDRDYLEGSAISNIIPGPIFVNFTVFAAHKLGGWRMVPIGLLLVLVPGAVAMVALSSWYGAADAHGAVVAAGLSGLSAGAAALTVVTPVRLVQSGRLPWRTLVLAGATFLALGPLHLSIITVVPVLALAGLWLERPRSEERR